MLLWDLLCPVCRISSEIKDTLRAIRDHGHCPACNLDYPLDFASSVELIFRVHPEIRHGRPGHLLHRRPGPLAARAGPGAGRRRGAHRAGARAARRRVPAPRAAAPLVGRLPGAAGPQPTRLWEIDLAAGPDRRRRPDAPRRHQVLTLVNELERRAPRPDRADGRPDDALTAARAASLALFRELFPGEVLSPGQLATVSTVTLLAAELDPAQADALYQDLGDARAFNVIHELFRLLGEAVRDAGGRRGQDRGRGAARRVRQTPPRRSAWALSFKSRLATRRLDPQPEAAAGDPPRHGAGRQRQRPPRLLRHDRAAGAEADLATSSAGELALAPAVAARPRSRRAARGPGHRAGGCGSEAGWFALRDANAPGFGSSPVGPSERIDRFHETPRRSPPRYQGHAPVTTPVRASVQTATASSLGREPDTHSGIGLTAEAGGFARLNHWLTPVVTISVMATW